MLDIFDLIDKSNSATTITEYIYIDNLRSGHNWIVWERYLNMYDTTLSDLPCRGWSSRSPTHPGSSAWFLACFRMVWTKVKLWVLVDQTANHTSWIYWGSSEGKKLNTNSICNRNWHTWYIHDGILFASCKNLQSQRPRSLYTDLPQSRWSRSGSLPRSGYLLGIQDPSDPLGTFINQTVQVRNSTYVHQLPSGDLT